MASLHALSGQAVVPTENAGCRDPVDRSCSGHVVRIGLQRDSRGLVPTRPDRARPGRAVQPSAIVSAPGLEGEGWGRCR